MTKFHLMLIGFGALYVALILRSGLKNWLNVSL